MRLWQRAGVGAVGLVLAAVAGFAADPPVGLKDAPSKEGFPKFKVQEIASDLTIGYAVLLADINSDKKPDIVIVDKHRVVWYENPTWKVRTILQGKTKPDNVCVTALDITGDGNLELVLGAGWRPADTKSPGTLQWLKRGKTLDEEWTMYPIPCDEPTVHRMRAADLDGDGKPEIVMAPLHGRECTPKGNWTDGRPVRIVAYKVPAEPTDPKAWKPEVLNEELHVVHNFEVMAAAKTPDGLKLLADMLVVSYEGVYSGVYRGLLGEASGVPLKRVGTGNQANPMGSRGASEVKSAMVGGTIVIATIEPWHGNQVVVYTPRKKPTELWTRHVIDEQLRWGHAISFADLDGDGSDDLIAGVRDDPNPKLGDTFTERRGVRLYRCTDGQGEKWERHILEDGGVAVEDLAVGDLNGDGRPDIVAVGRQTGNCRIYWNQGK
jgi:hypothetical protein